ncbi:hypothetical protein GC177_10315 [bacterium]|nr:hypothetical protein [bacterium]
MGIVQDVELAFLETETQPRWVYVDLINRPELDDVQALCEKLAAQGIVTEWNFRDHFLRWSITDEDQAQPKPLMGGDRAGNAALGNLLTALKDAGELPAHMADFDQHLSHLADLAKTRVIQPEKGAAA